MSKKRTLNELRQVKTFGYKNRTMLNKSKTHSEGTIHERNPDTGEIRSRDTMSYGSEKITTDAQSAISRSEILDEIWAADKHTHDGEWFVRLSDVCAILGEDYARKDK